MPYNIDYCFFLSKYVEYTICKIQSTAHNFVGEYSIQLQFLRQTTCFLSR
jgi:hypothetical protein